MSTTVSDIKKIREFIARVHKRSQSLWFVPVAKCLDCPGAVQESSMLPPNIGRCAECGATYRIEDP